MTALQISLGRRLSLPRAFQRLATSLRALGARTAAGARHAAPWYSLDERLLRDMGKSPLDAELALHQNGKAASEEFESVAQLGIGADQFKRLMTRECYRRSE